MVVPNITEKFNELNFNFEHVSQDHKFTDASSGEEIAEADILLENDDTVNVRDYAHKTGLCVIEQAGDTVKIPIPTGFCPRSW